MKIENQSNENKNYIKKNMEMLGRKYDIRKVFEDFVICAAYAISNKVNYDQKKEDQYLSIVSNYQKEEINEFGQMLAHLILEYMKEEPLDILGELYEEFNMSNKQKGQFFTPETVCDLISSTIIQKDEAKKTIEEKGYLSISDPACGSGRMLLSVLKRLDKEKVDINKIYFEGDDVSLFCSCMTYINLSLMGASAIIKNKDTLLNETYHVFYTPGFAINYDLQSKIKKEMEKEIENE